VDAEDFAVTRIEGSPAKNPSFWINSATVVHHYHRTGRFWLPASNHSAAQVKVFGLNEVAIEYFDYVTNDAHAKATPGASAEGLR
jgi:hypothetical protein